MEEEGTYQTGWFIPVVPKFERGKERAKDRSGKKQESKWKRRWRGVKWNVVIFCNIFFKARRSDRTFIHQLHDCNNDKSILIRIKARVTY